MSNSQPNTIPTNTPYCKTIIDINDLMTVGRCPYWRWQLDKETSEHEGFVICGGYCEYYKQYLLDDDVRLLECLAEWGDDYEY